MFTPAHESDDEATIEKEERDMEKVCTYTVSEELSFKAFLCPIQEGSVDYTSEIRQLEAEGEIPIMDLIASLPTDIMDPTDIMELPDPVNEQGQQDEEEATEGVKEDDTQETREERKIESTPIKRKTRLIYTYTCM